MGINKGEVQTKVSNFDNHAVDPFLNGLENRVKKQLMCPDRKEKIDRILLEMKNSSDRMERLLGVFNRMNRGL